MRPRIPRPLIVLLCIGSPFASAHRFATDVETYTILDGGETAGPSGAFREAFAGEIRALANLSINATGSDVKAALEEIERRARENATAIDSALGGASNMTQLLRAAYEEAHGAPFPPAQRTNLAAARAGLLTEAVLQLYSELGQPLTMEQEMEVRANASTLPPSAAIAGAVAIHALIDAVGYSRAAFENMDWRDAESVLGQASEAAFLTAGVELDTSQEAYTVNVTPSDLLNGTRNLTRTMRSLLLYQAADVLAQAADEIASMTIVPPVSTASTECGSSVAFRTPNCLIVLGGAGDGAYWWMEHARSARQSNSVLIDFGGNDLYENHAGAGYMLSNLPAGCDPLDTTYERPVCFTNLQLNLDLGAGADRYESPRNSRSQWSQGAGFAGVGLLYDGGGNDRYNLTRARATQNAGYGQGFASLGVGMLVDAGGNDVYEAWEQSVRAPIRAQAAAIGPGLAILHDAAGSDQYHANATGTDDGSAQTLAGGYQASATSAGVAYLVDEGAGDDHYSAGHQYVQAAASFGGFAYLSDGGGDNAFQLVSGLGCHAGATMRIVPPDATTTGCASGRTPVPTAGWSQGYADTGGLAMLLLGAGNDRFVVRLAGDRANDHEDLARLAAAGPGGVAILVNTGGRDEYGSLRYSAGFADFGVGIFSDRAGDDHYGCAVQTCHAHSSRKGAAAFYDGVSSGDWFGDGLDATRTASWQQTEGGFALGLHVAPASGGCCTSGGGSMLARNYHLM